MKYPHMYARSVAEHLRIQMFGACGKIEIVGSLRRGKPEVSDIELLYVPRFETERDGLFETVGVNMAEKLIARWLADGTLAKRPSVKGTFTWGDKNKLAIHCATGIPVDLFSTTDANWHNSLVCRTGSHKNNVRICMAANSKGAHWNVYGPGFTLDDGKVWPVTCEEDVFRFVGLPYLKPEER